MAFGFRTNALAPAGLIVDRVTVEADAIEVCVRSPAVIARCPLCSSPARRIHSRYVRRVADLPFGGRPVRLRLTARRFVCEQARCPRRIFGEPFAGVLGRGARRVERLETVVHHLGLALGGRPGAGLARRLMLPVSNDTLLRVVRRRTMRPDAPLRVVGVDDWAFRRNCRYGSIVVDLERRRPVALLPDREIATVAAWLGDHSGIAVVARDRGGGYGEAAARVLPHAVQVADRWHLMENASAAFLNAVRAAMTPIRRTLGATRIDPKLLTVAERLQYEGYLRRARADEAVLSMAREGLSIKAIARRAALARGTVRRILRGEHGDAFRTRQSSLEAWLPVLAAEWTEGCANGAELWRRLRRRGFQGSLRVVTEWATRRRRSEAKGLRQLQRAPSAKTIAKAMTIERDRLTKGDAILVASIEAAAPELAKARVLLDRFHAMVRRHAAQELDPWIADASPSLLGSFTRGVVRDQAAVRAALGEPWSNGQTEGQITKLKLIKRQMYGRAKLDLLEARLIGAG
ncbi:ISL3 family transposase [Chenggangzhangella methanolivorans]|uniref:ISL3 family transposase n=1 Tax=Chenggangzhangella methanolivorans TaxID=1437009 RepID=A0A9E6REK9_9HYPH|nr:ISL3 family transposase [Chenggangzhangella methanolivorans]QZO02113.1 ISL3 family transposase [Chenggangzhangella methanolivorans]